MVWFDFATTVFRELQWQISLQCQILPIFKPHDLIFLNCSLAIVLLPSYDLLQLHVYYHIWNKQIIIQVYVSCHLAGSFIGMLFATSYSLECRGQGIFDIYGAKHFYVIAQFIFSDLSESSCILSVQVNPHENIIHYSQVYVIIPRVPCTSIYKFKNVDKLKLA